MLIIYYSLQTAGIETFIIRLAEERKRNGLRTLILLFDIKNSSPEILARAKKSAEVLDIKSLLVPIVKLVFTILPKIPGSVGLLMELPVLRQEMLDSILKNINHIHVTSPANLHLAYLFLKRANIRIPVSAGFYHSETFGISSNKKLSYFQKVDYELIYNILPRPNLVAFNDLMPEIYRTRYNIDLTGITIFPLGVISNDLTDIEQNREKHYNQKSKIVKICSVGRLVDFKTYNLWMLDVIHDLSIEGYHIEYDIYGNGELKETIKKKIIDLRIENVALKGVLPYNLFRETVIKYDLFVGSGTAIIEAAALGVPSIIGIERIREPFSYGFLCDIPNFTYNEEGVKDVVEVKELIRQFAELDAYGLYSLRMRNIRKAQEFTIETCSQNFIKLGESSKAFNLMQFNYNKFRYVLSTLNISFLERLKLP